MASDSSRNKVVVTNLEKTASIDVVQTMNDKITADSTWCGTFQLVWNDMKNEVVKKDIVFSPQLDMVDNLNKEDFNETMISEKYYYKIYGLKSLELKEQIENGIKEKFNQTSDIINDFGWTEDELDNPENPNLRRYFFYSMLYRKFEFLKEFDKLENGDFAIEINTKTNDEVIFCKNPSGDNFSQIYENMNNKAEKL